VGAELLRGDAFCYGKVTPVLLHFHRMDSLSGRITATLMFNSLGPDTGLFTSENGYPKYVGYLNGLHWDKPSQLPYPRDSLWQRLGFYKNYHRGVRPLMPEKVGPKGRTYETARLALVAVPHWCGCLLTLPLPLGWFVARRRRLRRLRRVGYCRNCDYDLRAHKPGERCPECGELVPAASVEADTR
jgi:hypothetical protein